MSNLQVSRISAELNETQVQEALNQMEAIEDLRLSRLGRDH